MKRMLENSSCRMKNGSIFKVTTSKVTLIILDTWLKKRFVIRTVLFFFYARSVAERKITFVVVSLSHPDQWGELLWRKIISWSFELKLMIILQFKLKSKSYVCFVLNIQHNQFKINGTKTWQSQNVTLFMTFNSSFSNQTILL